MKLLTRTVRTAGAARALSNLSTPPTRPQCLVRLPATLPLSRDTQHRLITSSSPRSNYHEPYMSNEELKRMRDAAEERRQYYKRRSIYNGIGFVTGMIAIWVIATSVELPQKPTKLDSGDRYYNARLNDPLMVVGNEHKTVVQKLGDDPAENADTVETGTSTVPTFPRLMQFNDVEGGDGTQQNQPAPTEYQLLGLGIRSVTFLGVQVYVVGMYIATDDIAQLQRSLIKKIDPIATTLVSGEKENLRAKMMDPEASEEIWNHVLSSTNIRSLFRIVPVRDTDFGHMRDAYVRAVTSQSRKRPEEFGDDKFGESVRELKAMFGHNKLLKGKEMVLSRNEKGSLVAWYDTGDVGPKRMGEVDDERIPRALWLHYLAGNHVASEPARKNIVEGIMEFVERPLGTVAAQVHV